jgi:peptidyl-prolyl cis-trans isomerase B (cyclophilin B)
MVWKFPAPMKNLFLLGVVSFMLSMSLGAAEEVQADDKKKAAKPETKAAAPDTAKPVAKEVAVIKTSEGEMVLEFYPDVAPNHVENFKKLANKGYYDGQCFHRVIKGFMIQGGDPNTKDESKKDQWGQGGPGYTIKAEFNQKPHVRGTLSMARTPDPNSAGSQFFICHGSPSFLDGQYTVFGQLIKGDAVLEKIATTETEGPDRPVKRVTIESIKIVAADSIK